jgi:nitrite reductase (NADH) large subunit
MAKTCVGSTWCRYGVGDSVGFGVELENRYKGITPHKMKFGVSGCTRECAEARVKTWDHRHRERLEPVRVR